MAAAAAAATAVAGFVLTDAYFPIGARGPVLRPDLRRADVWLDRHLWAGIAFLVLSVATTALAVRHLVRSRQRDGVLGLVCAAVATAAALVTLLTRDLVGWDQLGLWSVTVGTDLHGYGAAAFSDDVRFVLVGGTEVSQRTYAAGLYVHLAAPVLGAVLLALAGVLALRARRDGGARGSAAPAASLGRPA